MTSRRSAFALLVALFLFSSEAPAVAQTASPSVQTRTYGRAVIDVDTSRAVPGGVFAIGIRNARWAAASTLMDGRRGAMSNETGRLFGLIPIPLDTSIGEHKISLFFPGGRGVAGATSFTAPVTPVSRPNRARPLTPDQITAAQAQMALGHGRFLLAAIRTRDLPGYQIGPLRPPVDQPIIFPFGGIEDFGLSMGPVKDGLIGEQHRGVDYDVPEGTVVKAPGSGVVLLARSLVFSGETIVIGHGHGVVSVLSHLTHVSVREGDVVNQGTAVGTSGKTGLGAFTAHLCFSVYLHSVNVDPEVMMDATLWPAGK
ncbi:MAG: M23 family metallopeptidase [Vicinamibacteria bacterium]